MARAGLTTDRVATAAADLADRIGFDKVTISALARGFGVKDASLYSHVRNLQDLRNKVAMIAARDMAERIVPAVAGRAGKDALVAFAHAYRDYALAHPGRYAAGQSQLPPELVAESQAHQRVFEACYALLRGYGLSEPDMTDAVRVLRSAFHGFVSLEASGGFGHPRDVGASWERAIDALHSMLEHWPS
ncbi:TetR/AcrR family transcriptional regulator [Nonomuraea sp. NPDC059194]|uniref:TetR/AcrR family transcriptional regulator n=1 Tax=Nonomuraea sp. NPDC059194 TaxID=3346764 RepID=UPI0036AC317F